MITMRIPNSFNGFILFFLYFIMTWSILNMDHNMVAVKLIVWFRKNSFKILNKTSFEKKNNEPISIQGVPIFCLILQAWYKENTV